MKLHFAFAVTAMTALCACTNGSGPASQLPSIESGYTPIAFVPPPPGFCQDVATSDRLRAQMSGFDTQTVERIATRSLQQCDSLLAMSPNAHSPTLRVVSAAK